MSRSAHPKQLLRLRGEASLFQSMVQLLSGEGFAEPIVVCNREHRFGIAEQLDEIGLKARAIILEPSGRNTAPAVAAALAHLGTGSTETVLVAPCDLEIGAPEAFLSAVSTSQIAADAGMIVTFGVVPTRAEVGFGYIERGPVLDGMDGVFAIRAFHEKPTADKAESFLQSGQHYWNGGLFLAKASILERELHIHAPEVVEFANQSVSAGEVDFGFFRLEEKSFKSISSIGIDHAVMENTDSGAVVPIDCGWNDLGSWAAIADTEAIDERGNAARGPAVIFDSDRNYVRSEKPLVALVGVTDLTVVATDDAVLVVDRSRSQDVKEIVAQLDASDRQEHLTHTTIYRPWGKYQDLDSGPGFKVKRITVKPGRMLSLQRHRHRSEHWVVVSGRATVTRGDEILILGANESTYIPAGTVHRLANEEADALEMIEVQTGSVLLEEDIERLSDDYGRK
jgi:mannose-1-phosphate guanylyltransferase/mannose-6-phosphate isomerase